VLVELQVDISSQFMKEGSIFAVIYFPENWPPPLKSIIFQEKVNDSQICIFVNNEGQLEINIDSENFTSQTILFTLAKRGILSIFWDLNKTPKLKAFLNSVELKSYDCKEIFYVKSQPEIKDYTLSFDHEEASTLCQEWISWRSGRYSSPKLYAKQYRRIKSIDQQIQDLNDSLASLNHYVCTFKNQERLFLMNTLPHLRSLLFWADRKSKNYNPLLFRVAGYLKLPLPIFAFKDRIKNTIDNPLFSDALLHRDNNYPSVTQQYSNQELLDFQEWLNMEIIVDRSEAEQKIYRWKDILFESANTISAAHFDDDIPIFIDKLQDSICFNTSLFYNYIMTITQTTLTLGKYVISKAKNTSSSIDSNFKKNY